MRFNQKIYVLGLALAGLSLSACQRENQADWSVSTDNAIAEEVFQDVFRKSSEAAESNGGAAQPCVSIALDNQPGTFPDTITLTFNGQICQDGRRRSGRLFLYLSGPWRQNGSTLNVVSDGYAVNDYLVVGSKLFTNTSTGTALQYTAVVNNARIFAPGGTDSVTWSCNKTVTQIAGENTNWLSNGLNGILDDIYEVDGTANGISRNGTAYTVNTTSPLIRRMDCRWIVQGIMEVTPSGREGYTVDFGDGTCDAQAQLTWRRWTRNILLPQ